MEHKHSHWPQESLMKFCPQCAGSLAKKPVAPEFKLQLVCEACAFIFYLNPKVVACAIPQCNGKAVLLRRNIEPSFGKWTFPGGFVDLGETVQQAAVREAKEETNLDIEITSLLDVYSYPDVPIVIIVYLANVIDGQMKPGVEAQEVLLFSPEEIPWEGLAFQSTKDALTTWIKRAMELERGEF